MRAVIAISIALLSNLAAAQNVVATSAGNIGMVSIPGGNYHPMYSGSGDLSVAAFRIDRTAVTQGQFAQFVQQHPEWRRNRIRNVVPSYLAGWSSDLEPGDATRVNRPATSVTWYAASAYCESRGARLPMLSEWEYVGAADGIKHDASRDPRQIQHLVDLYSTRGTMTGPVQASEMNAYGVRGMHDLVWEWVADPNPAIAAINHARHVAHISGAAGQNEQHDLSCAGSALGAADPHNYPAFLRSAVRSMLKANTALSTMGFRCAG